MIEILWLLFAFFQGVSEGSIFHGRPPVLMRGYNIHLPFNISRCIVYVALALELRPEKMDIFMFSLFCAGTFALVHDAGYYETRKYQSYGSIYPRGWLSESKTTDARLSYSFNTRLIMFAVGAGLHFGYLAIKHLV